MGAGGTRKNAASEQNDSPDGLAAAYRDLLRPEFNLE
jgi:hypothetical protein